MIYIPEGIANILADKQQISAFVRNDANGGLSELERYDLMSKIQARTDALVSKGEVSREVSVESKAAEKVVIEANAEMLALVIGRGGGIRTHDPLAPNQMRYQAALRPDIVKL